MVIIDTCVWSASLRRKNPDEQIQKLLRKLIEEGRASLLNPVRQELLCGLGNPTQFQELKIKLRAFESPRLDLEDFELAADYFNICRAKGVQGSNTDFLLCAVAKRRDWEIFTTDADFSLYQRHLGMRLFTPVS